MYEKTVCAKVQYNGLLNNWLLIAHTCIIDANNDAYNSPGSKDQFPYSNSTDIKKCTL